MNRLKSILSELFYKVALRIFNILSTVVPKKQNLYAFYPLHDSTKLSGNLRAMVFYIRENHKDIEIIIITKKRKLQAEITKMGLSSVYIYSGFSWTLLRANTVFIDASITALLVNSKISIIQLWHGVGFKNIALLNDNISKKTYDILAKFYKKYNLLITSSNDDFKKKRDSFQSPNIAITGSPRNDVFFSDISYFKKIKLKYKLESYSQIVSYAPTFRDFETTEPFSENFWNTIQAFMEKTNQVFIVTKHPLDRYLKVPSNYKNIKDLSKLIDDPQELLLISDLLITDYSSISTDFALTGKPILIYAYDFEEYKNNCRSIYYDLEEILPKPFVNNENELLDKLMDRTWEQDRSYLESYGEFQKIFHKYMDGQSCERVMNEILKLKE